VSLFGFAVFKAIKAVIFDLDGLLIDSESSYRSAWQQALTQMGYSLERAFFDQLVGAEASRVEQLLIDQLDSAFDLTAFRHLSAECWHTQVNRTGIPLMPGVESVLTACKRLRWPTVVATNSVQTQAHKLLELAGLSAEFKQVLASDQVANPKPAPDIYLLAAASLSLKPTECLVLEDSLTGITAALAAQMPCCWIPASAHSVPQHLPEHCLVLPSLHEVAARIEALSV